MPDIIDRIQKLVRLATKNPNASEASAAALKAVRMIAEHRIRLALPGYPLFHEEIPVGEWPVRTPTQAEYDDLWRRANARGQHQSPPPRRPPPARPRARKPVVSPFRHWRIENVAEMFVTDRRDIARLFFRQWRPRWQMPVKS